MTILDKTCAAFYGTPMWDWLQILKFGEDVLGSEDGLIGESPIETAQKCCQDPEYCSSAVCVECPLCQGFETTRTTPPDEDNVSEFVCNGCGKYFTAVNP